MKVTKLAVGLGVVLLGFLCWMAAAGFRALTELLVSGAVLVVLVAGGNWIGGRSTPRTSAVVQAPEDGTLPIASGTEIASGFPGSEPLSVSRGSDTSSIEVPSPSPSDARNQPGTAEGGHGSGSDPSSTEAPEPSSTEAPDPAAP